jgi:hypothetical protein
MKKVIGIILICLFVSVTSQAQSNAEFGVKGGVNLTFFNVDQGSFGLRAKNQVSYYGGVFLDFHVNETFSFQPELLYIGLVDFRFINAPFYAKYEVAKNLDILVGPSLNYFFDFFSNKLKVRGDISTAFHITQAIDVHIKYTLGFEVISPNGLFLGAGYRF